jgi:hypothetical protein
MKKNDNGKIIPNKAKSEEIKETKSVDKIFSTMGKSTKMDLPVKGKCSTGLKSEELVHKEKQEGKIVPGFSRTEFNKNALIEEGESNKKFEDLKFIKKNKRCCIVGFAPSWDIAPYQDKDVDFWGINELYLNLKKIKPQPKFSAWFEVHDIEKSPSKQKPEHQEFLKMCKIPIITQKHWDKYPSTIAYPVDYVIEFFNKNFIIDAKNTGFSDYSNQISWMIALAICLGYEEIMVYGVDMAQDSEYRFQRASCQFFLGYALGANIKIRIPAACELLKAGALYGFESDNTNRFRKKDRIKSCSENLTHLKCRNAEIGYFKDYLDKQYNKDSLLIDSEIELLEKQITDLDSMITVADNIINFINTMPETLAEIDKAKVKLLNGNIAGRDRAKKDIDKIKSDITALKKKKEKIGADTYVNHKLLDEEFENNKHSISSLEGSIYECKHDLNNNLV